MYVHREGYKTIGLFAIVSSLIIFLAVQFLATAYPILAITISLLSLFLFLFIISFFRVPKRKLIYGDDLIIAPADGKIVVIEEVYDEEYFKDKRLQVSIFMSPLNVHLNRHPINGEVVYSKYHKGLYLVAWNPKSSTENERHSVVYTHKSGKQVLAKQIAGALAKRICNYADVGSTAVQNEELGFIKFGSRVDLLLPLNTKLNVQLNQMVKNGIDVIGNI